MYYLLINWLYIYIYKHIKYLLLLLLLKNEYTQNYNIKIIN